MVKTFKMKNERDYSTIKIATMIQITSHQPYGLFTLTFITVRYSLIRNNGENEDTDPNYIVNYSVVWDNINYDSDYSVGSTEVENELVDQINQS